MGVWLKIGSRSETSELNGVAHFIEHLLFKGTSHRTAEEIARQVDSIGGHLDAFTAKETICYSTKVLDEHLPIAFDILSDLVLNPKFDPGDMEKERSVILEEIKMVEDTPDDLVHEIFMQNFWKDQPLGRPILGTKQTVGKLDRDKVLDFFTQFYTPDDLIVSAAGNLEHERVADLIRGKFGKRQHLAERPRGRSGPHAQPNQHAQQEGTGAGAYLLGCAFLSSFARRSLCLLHPEHYSRWRNEFTAVSKHP